MSVVLSLLVCGVYIWARNNIRELVLLRSQEIVRPLGFSVCDYGGQGGVLATLGGGGWVHPVI